MPAMGKKCRRLRRENGRGATFVQARVHLGADNSPPRRSPYIATKPETQSLERCSDLRIV